MSGLYAQQWDVWRREIGAYLESGDLALLRDGMSQIATAARALASTLAADERPDAKRSRRALLRVDKDCQRIVSAAGQLELHFGDVHEPPERE